MPGWRYGAHLAKLAAACFGFGLYMISSANSYVMAWHPHDLNGCRD